MYVDVCLRRAWVVVCVLVCSSMQPYVYAYLYLWSVLPHAHQCIFGLVKAHGFAAGCGGLPRFRRRPMAAATRAARRSPPSRLRRRRLGASVGGLEHAKVRGTRSADGDRSAVGARRCAPHRGGLSVGGWAGWRSALACGHRAVETVERRRSAAGHQAGRMSMVSRSVGVCWPRTAAKSA